MIQVHFVHSDSLIAKTINQIQNDNQPNIRVLYILQSQYIPIILLLQIRYAIESYRSCGISIVALLFKLPRFADDFGDISLCRKGNKSNPSYQTPLRKLYDSWSETSHPEVCRMYFVTSSGIYCKGDLPQIYDGRELVKACDELNQRLLFRTYGSTHFQPRTNNLLKTRMTERTSWPLLLLDFLLLVENITSKMN